MQCYITVYEQEQLATKMLVLLQRVFFFPPKVCFIILAASFALMNVNSLQFHQCV